LSENLITHLSENKNSSVSQTLILLSPAHHREVEVGFEQDISGFIYKKINAILKD